MATLKKKITSSSTIAEVEYNPDIEELTVKFLSGFNYVYSKVPFKLYMGLINAGSVGKYFWKNIRDKFPTRKVR